MILLQCLSPLWRGFSAIAIFGIPGILAGELEQTVLFRAGEGGYDTYRIPGIVVTASGTAIVYAEARKGGGGDWGEIDIVMRRSEDAGAYWDEPRKIVTPPSDLKPNFAAVQQSIAVDNLPTMNNPVAIADREAGNLHFIYCAEYARCFYLRSADDGRTFSNPIEITPTFEAFRTDYDWKVIATGPGHGIQLQNGRLIVPVWLSTGTGGHAHRPSAVSVIYSDDSGENWARGEVVVNHPTLNNPSETSVVELADGQVMLNIRHESEPRYRAISLSQDGISNWSHPRLDQQLPDPVCMGSLARLSLKATADRNRLLFVNAHNSADQRRRNVSVKMSYDEGKSWPVMRTLEPGPSAYADLAVGPHGTIYCFYEQGNGPKTLTLARFDEEWLIKGE